MLLYNAVSTAEVIRHQMAENVMAHFAVYSSICQKRPRTTNETSMSQFRFEPDTSQM
jgi:hypothetical protein